jgi:hypothetical protein
MGMLLYFAAKHLQDIARLADRFDYNRAAM